MNGQNNRNDGRDVRRPPMTNEQKRILEERRRRTMQTGTMPRQQSRNYQTGQIPAGRPVKSPAPAKKSILSGRNLILAAILVGLLIITLVILGVQSCSDKGKNGYNSDGKNKVHLKVDTTSADGGKNASPAYAEYGDNTPDLMMDSDYGILIDLSDNHVIASRGGDKRIYPASMTKIMTLIVAYEHADSLEDTHTFTAEELDPLYAENASEAGFAAGETVTVQDMLYGCILPSGADATVGLASCIAGSEDNFVDLMNDKVKELGLKDTHFVTVSGLHHKDHYSTCHEMALILEYAISDPYMREVLSTYKYTTAPTAEHPEGIELTSTLFTRMAGDEAKGIFVQGGKTGFTNEALNCLATFAARCTEDMAPYVKPEFLLVTAHVAGEYTPIFDAIHVYEKYCGGEG